MFRFYFHTFLKIGLPLSMNPLLFYGVGNQHWSRWWYRRTCSRGSLCSCLCSTASQAPPHNHILVVVDLCYSPWADVCLFLSFSPHNYILVVVDVIQHLLKICSIWPSVGVVICHLNLKHRHFENCHPWNEKRCCLCLRDLSLVFISFHRSIAAVMVAMGWH